MTRHRRSAYFVKTLALLLLLALVTGVVAAQTPQRLHISDVNAADFPEVSVTFFAQDSNGSVVNDVGALQVTEDGAPIEQFTVAQRQVGIDAIFVINANTTIDVRDGGSTSRRIKVRDALNRFADNYMDESQLDRVTIIVPPDGDYPDGFLLRDAIFVNELKNAVNFYEPDPTDDVPLNDMLEQALAVAEDNAAEGRFQAVVLFTDGATEGNLLDYEALVARAQELDVTYYAAILGQRADDSEIANVEALFAPTFGQYVHMPETVAADELFATLQSFGFQQQLSFRSQVESTGEHTVGLALGGVAAERGFLVELSPPEVTILLDNSRPIMRAAATADTPLADIEPTSQTVVAQVLWPGAQEPRTLRTVALVVNGVPVLTRENVEVQAEGLVDLEWDISLLAAEDYDLTVRVVDDLGLEGVSPSLPLAIEVQRPEPVVEESGEPAEPIAEPTTVPAVTEVLEENIGIVTIVGGALAAVGALLALVLFFVFLRRRSGSAPAATPAAPAAVPAAAQAFDVESTQIMSPGFVQRQANAYLEAQEHAPEHSGTIFISGDNVAMGRDAKLAEIVFKDKSVSRLHARIMVSGGEFRLYDEGSASGTYHNYERVGLTPHTLQDNDDIHLGRVHLRFRKSAGGGGQPAGPADSDATQVFGPGQQPQRAPAPPAAVEDDMSTRPFMPHTPGPAGGSSSPSDDDLDDLSTKPYLPHTPER